MLPRTRKRIEKLEEGYRRFDREDAALSRRIEYLSKIVEGARGSIQALLDHLEVELVRQPPTDAFFVAVLKPKK